MGNLGIKLLVWALGLVALGYTLRWWMIERGRRGEDPAERRPKISDFLVGFVTNFFDTLGIGSFAPATAWFKFSKRMPDELIPGTLNSGQALPTMTQALILMSLVPVDFVTLISMDIAGKIVGVKVLKHSEPILLVGIPETELTKFIRQYIGKFAWNKVEIGKARAEGGYIGIDAISGATVTVISENQVVIRSVYEIAKQVGIIKAVPRTQARFMPVSEQRTWNELLAEGSVSTWL